MLSLPLVVDYVLQPQKVPCSFPVVFTAIRASPVWAVGHNVFIDKISSQFFDIKTYSYGRKQKSKSRSEQRLRYG